jgi:protein-disulfide isomerase
MNEQQLNACVGDEKALNELNARVEKWATTAKITGTPTFDVNGKRLDGEQTLAALDKAIAEAQAKK